MAATDRKSKFKTTKSAADPRNWNRFSFLLLIAVLVPYVQILGFGLVQFDDHGFVLMASENLKLSNLAEFFRHSVFWVLGDTTQEHDVFYRPVQNVLYAICQTLAHEQPWIFHLAGLILHAVAVQLFFRFLALLGAGPTPAFLFALLYAVHPVLVQGVAWIAGTGDQLAMIFVMAAMMNFIRGFQPGDPKKRANNLMAHGVFFALAMFTKEISLMMVPVAMAWYSWMNHDKNRRLMMPMIIIWSAVIGMYFIVRSAAIHASGSGLGAVFGSFRANAPLILEYLEKIFVPWRLSPIPSREDAIYWPGLLVLSGLIGLLIWRRRFNPWLGFGLAWFLLFLLPTFIQQNPEAHFFAFEHRLYIPLSGVVIAAMGAAGWKDEDYAAPVRKYMMGALAGIFVLVSFFHARTFTDPYTFYDKALSASPRSVIAYNGYGKFLLTERKYAEAVEVFKKSHAIKQDDIETTGKIASLYMEHLNNPKEAAIWYEKSLVIDPRSVKAAVSLAEVYWNGLSDTASAERAYRRAMEIEPGNTHALAALGNLALIRGSHAEAQGLLKKALDASQENLMAYKWLAISLFAEGKIAEAVQFLLRGYEKYPDDADLLRNLAVCYFQLQDKENFIRFQKLCRERGVVLPDGVR